MLRQENRDTERKLMAILTVLRNSAEPVGARVIAGRLEDLGVQLGERGVRYHLRLMDERGLTRLVGRRDGREITEVGVDELRSALVGDRVGSVTSRIETLAYFTSLDLDSCSGEVPLNTSLFHKEDYADALKAMRPVFAAGLCVSDLVLQALEADRLAGMTVPPGKAGLSTVSSIAIAGVLIRAGVPLHPSFTGLLELRDGKPHRFTELIDCSGCSLDPAEVFIAGRMTSAAAAAATGNGEIVAELWQLPAACEPAVERTVERLKQAGLDGVAVMGRVNTPVCEVSVDPDRVGLVLKHGLNPVAAAVEAGIEVRNHSMSGVADWRSLRSFVDF